MSQYAVALFGEAEKGEISVPYTLHSVAQLASSLGTPPEASLGLYCAVQALLYGHELLFFRVREEGYSESDYLYGLALLRSMELSHQLAAIVLPGVGSRAIVSATDAICQCRKCLLLMHPDDLYDYLTTSTFF